ncbi:MAG: hypothetical protein SPK35_09705 [Prevotella sp.]|nr:hypothetical protein [Prevotella sp.]
MRFRIAAIILILFTTVMPGRTQEKDSDQLGMAIEYFQSGKYHEALNIFCKLETRHELNPRFKAYMGVCFYYEWDYANACAYLDKVLPLLTKLAPHERSFYYFACAESHFELQEYEKALPLYNEMATICYDNEKADAYYKIGFIYMFRQQWTDALDNFQSALVYYTQFRPDQKSRITQIRNMINGCAQEIERK